jgi:hypothetical protein
MDPFLHLYALSLPYSAVLSRWQSQLNTNHAILSESQTYILWVRRIVLIRLVVLV